MTGISDSELRDLAVFAKKRWGLILDEAKRVMVGSRIQALRSKVKFDSVEELLRNLERSPNSKVELEIFDVLSTNFTSFFREALHFEVLREGVLDPWKAAGGGRLRVWSAGCSMGCEPYTLSMVINEVAGTMPTNEVRILATDLSNEVLQKAHAGVYTKDHIGATDTRLVSKYLSLIHISEPTRPY